MRSAREVWFLLNNGDVVIDLTHAKPGVYPGWPIPVMAGGRLTCLAFYQMRANLPGQAAIDYHPPRYVAEVEWESGRFLSFQPQPAAFFGVNGDPFARQTEEEIRRDHLKWPVNGTLRETEQRLLDSYDALLPNFVAGRPVDLAQAQTFGLLFRNRTSEPMRPVYYHLGRPFFHWVGLD